MGSVTEPALPRPQQQVFEGMKDLLQNRPRRRKDEGSPAFIDTHRVPPVVVFP